MSDVSEHRPLLFSIAYRMLGRVTEAEDMVQEAFLRWHKQDQAAIREPKAWLTTAVTRLCIDQMRSVRRQREEYVGVWLPEPIIENDATPADLADSLGTAFMMMLEELKPVERAAFLLREAFGHDYAVIAEITGKSEANCRQMVSRAKARLGKLEEVRPTSTEEAERLVKEFLTACETGELKDLMSLLTDDAILYSDGGGVVRAAIRPIYGPDKISRMFLGLRERSIVGWQNRIVSINGSPGVITKRRDGSINVTTFAFEGGKLKAIYLVRNPNKLEGVRW
jgi:RNA polymerase sigma-70 factor, ECF subfamily